MTQPVMSGVDDLRPVFSSDLSFIGEVRTHLTTILGFSAMMAEGRSDLSTATHAEYAAIVATSGELLIEVLERETAIRRRAA